MRETIAWQAFHEMGVDSLLSFQAVIRLNGKYYGKFAVGEDWEAESLKKNGYSVDPQPGILLKSQVCTCYTLYIWLLAVCTCTRLAIIENTEYVLLLRNLSFQSGEYSNLRWDIPFDQVQYYYDKVTVRDSSADAALVELSKGLAGGGSLPRSVYVFENINIPKVRV